MHPVIESIKNTHRISAEAELAMQKRLNHHVVDKDDFLLQAGQVCHRLYFVVKGGVRGYYYAGGKELTHWFGFESDIVTSFHSFITKTPGIEYLQAIESSEFWSISYDDLYELYDQYPDIERFGRITCEQYYIRLEDRYVNAQFKTALERYQNMMQNTPHILQRVALGQIASYLGISQETLSRIRSKAIGV